MVINEQEYAHLLFAEAFNSGDMDSMMALYKPEVTLVPQSGQAVKGISATGEALQGSLALKVRIIVETKYIVRTEDVAILRGKWRLAGTGPDGKSIEMDDNGTEVIRRQPDGSWLFVNDHPFGAD